MANNTISAKIEMRVTDKRFREIVQNQGCLTEIESVRWAIPFYQLGQVASFNILHHQEMHASRLIGIKGGDDIRMGEPGHRLRLTLKSARHVWRIHHRIRDDFEGYDSLHAPVLGL